MTDALPFGDNSFDVVISRLGVMFFPRSICGSERDVAGDKTARRVGAGRVAKE